MLLPLFCFDSLPVREGREWDFPLSLSYERVDVAECHFKRLFIKQRMLYMEVTTLHLSSAASTLSLSPRRDITKSYSNFVNRLELELISRNEAGNFECRTSSVLF
jgi:hypothetical protein